MAVQGAEQLAVVVARNVCEGLGLQQDDEDLQLFIYLLVEFWDQNA